MTRPDRTQFYFDCDGYLSSIVDKNGNTMSFTYEVRKSQNKPTEFLRYITDATGRQTLTIDYWAKGDTYDYIDDNTWAKGTGQANLTNPFIIDHVKQITDVSGRKLAFTYTLKGLLGQMIDGVGSAQPKTFRFQYDMTQGNKNVKLVKVTDPNGNATNLAYYSTPQDDPHFQWWTKTYTDRLGNPTSFAYTDPDGTSGSTIQTVVTDAQNHATTYLLDGFGRMTQSTNAKDQTTKLNWDADNNVVRQEEANGAASTWAYDPKTGYPTEIKNQEANKNGWAGTDLTYQTGLGGHIADLIGKVSPEGRTWTFGYDTAGNLTSVTDPNGNATSTPGDYTTTYTYDTFGQQHTATDANGHTTHYDAFDPTGFPGTTTDALQHVTTTVYDVRGHVTKVTDPLGKSTTQTYDTFGRAGERSAPKDQAAGLLIITPAPTYDANNNVLTSTSPVGAVTTTVYDAMDRVSYTLEPADNPGDPQRKTSSTYDKVGNLLTTTEPKGNLTSDPADFTTTYAYDEIDQAQSITNAEGGKTTYTYDNVGNQTSTTDPRKNATADPSDYTDKFSYNLAHRLTTITDATGTSTTTAYDHDGLPIATTDQAGYTTQTTYDARGQQIEVKVPHLDSGGTITYNTTRYEYDQVGNQIKMTTPRGVATAADPDDFAEVTTYDEVNRVKERDTPYNKSDPQYNTPDRTTYTYDAAGHMTAVSSPPSAGTSTPVTTTTTYFDNGWPRTTTDPWNIITSYDYDDLGGQTARTITSAGGSSSRTESWQYYPNGSLKSRTDDGVPVGKQVVLVDNSDFNNVTTTGTWSTATTGTNVYGSNYHTHPAGTGTDTFTWQLNVPQQGTYEVFVWYPGIAGAATNAQFTVAYAGGNTTKTVNETTNPGTWVSLGSYPFAESNTQNVTVTDQATGTVLADTVKLVRDNSADTDTESHQIAYRYDANGNTTTVSDNSPNTKIDTYATTYGALNEALQETESLAGAVKDTTSYTYNENGALASTTLNNQYSTYEYDTRDRISKITTGTSATDPASKVTTYTYADSGRLLHEVKGNGNTVDYTYFADGLQRTQTERRADGTLVAQHQMDYDPNGNRSTDSSSTMNADNHGAYLQSTRSYSYDPRDRVTQVTTTGTGADTETYSYDADNNITTQNVGGIASTFKYDRDRLLTANTGGLNTTYNYDPFGRADTVAATGSITKRYVYDGFDHVVQDRSTVAGTTTTTQYAFDALDRTTSTTTSASSGQTTTNFAYIGMSAQVEAEQTTGGPDKVYQYSPTGERLSQLVGGDTTGYYGYNAHTDVEQVTDNSGNTTATYGYTAYGSNTDPLFTGADKDATDPAKQPYNAYRYNGMRWDASSGTYDMGFRDYNPGLNRFLTRDSYNGALDDLNLSTDPWTGSRYAFGGGNPVSNVEVDGHCPEDTDQPRCQAGFAIPPVVPVTDPPVIFDPPSAPPDVPPVIPTLLESLAWAGIITCLLFCLTSDSAPQDEMTRTDTDERQRNCLDPDSQPTPPDYYPLDDRKRARGVEACLGPWSTYNADGRPADPAGFITNIGLNRAHLLARRFGGARIVQNIVPVWANTNISFMAVIENRVMRALGTEGRLFYQAVPVYPTRANPRYQEFNNGMWPIIIEYHVFSRSGPVISGGIPNVK
jgi:RHS repeat-associated protein